MTHRNDMYRRLDNAIDAANINVSMGTPESLREVVAAMESNDTDPSVIGFAIGLYYMTELDPHLVWLELYPPKAAAS